MLQFVKLKSREDATQQMVLGSKQNLLAWMNDEGKKGCKASKYHIDQEIIKQDGKEKDMMQKKQK